MLEFGEEVGDLGVLVCAGRLFGVLLVLRQLHSLENLFGDRVDVTDQQDFFQLLSHCEQLLTIGEQITGRLLQREGSGRARLLVQCWVVLGPHLRHLAPLEPTHEVLVDSDDERVDLPVQLLPLLLHLFYF